MKAILLALFLMLVLPTSNSILADATIDGRTNEYRSANNLTALSTSATLSEIALQRVQQLHEPLTHAGGEWIYDAMGCWTWAGENIAYNTNPATDWAAQWYNSDVHRANMLNPAFDEQGSAVRYDEATGLSFAVQIFRDTCGSESQGTTGSSTSAAGTTENAGQGAPDVGSPPQGDEPLLPNTSTVDGT